MIVWLNPYGNSRGQRVKIAASNSWISR